MAVISFPHTAKSARRAHAIRQVGLGVLIAFTFAAIVSSNGAVSVTDFVSHARNTIALVFAAAGGIVLTIGTFRAMRD